MNAKPERLNILGIPHTVTYYDKPSDVDSNGRESLWGEIDYWKRAIRIYDNKSNINDIWECITHEVLHGIGHIMHLDFLNNCKDDDLDLLALALTDFLFRNDLIKLDNKETV